MKTIKKILLILFLTFLGIFAASEVVLYFLYDRDPDYFQIDRCIDHGGCWDEIDKVCRKEETNAQELCDRSKVNGKTLEQRIEQKIEKIAN